MDHSTLTEEYLALQQEHGAVASELVGAATKSEWLNTVYDGRYLPRPLFLGHQEKTRLATDVANFQSALTSLPERLYDGDIEAFARDMGMTADQISAVLRSRSTPTTRQGRADLYLAQRGFQLLEFNLSSSVGGRANAELCRSLLEHPLLSGFVEKHNLGYTDTMREEIRNIHTETGFPADENPVVAMVDWPSSYETLGPFLVGYCARLRNLGLDAKACHLGQLEVRNGRVWHDGRPVDIILRTFLLEDLLESPDALSLMSPLLDTAAAGGVRIFTPLDSEMFTSKKALALLADERNRGLLREEELAGVDRLLPWTRMVRREPVTLENGEQADLLDYAVEHQNDLALKPTLQRGGAGVVLGWDRATTPELWREHLATALDGPFILQRRIRPKPEMFPDENGKPAPWLGTWGVFTGAHGFGGITTRATPLDADTGVVNVARGAFSGTAMYEQAPAAVERYG